MKKKKQFFIVLLFHQTFSGSSVMDHQDLASAFVTSKVEFLMNWPIID